MDLALIATEWGGGSAEGVVVEASRSAVQALRHVEDQISLPKVVADRVIEFVIRGLLLAVQAGEAWRCVGRLGRGLAFRLNAFHGRFQCRSSPRGGA